VVRLGTYINDGYLTTYTDDTLTDEARLTMPFGYLVKPVLPPDPIAEINSLSGLKVGE